MREIITTTWIFKYLPALFFMGLIHLSLSAKDFNHTKDSLEKRLPEVNDPALREKIFLELFEIHLHNNLEEGMAFANRALNDALERNNESQYSEFIYEIGKMYLSYGNYDSSLLYLKEAAAKFSQLNNLGQFANSIESIAIWHQEQGLYKTSVQLHQAARDIFNKLKDPVGVGHVYINIGNIYKDQENYEKALSYYLKAKEAYSLHTDDTYLPIALNNIGVYYKEAGDLDTAEILYKESIRIQDESGHREGLANSLNNLAGIYFQYGDMKKCRETLIRSIDIKKETGEYGNLPGGYMNLSYLYSAEEKYNEALNALNEAEYYAKIYQTPVIFQNILKSKAELYKSMGKISEAYEMLVDYTLMRDSLMSSENRAIAEELEKKYENDKIKKENLILNQEKLLQENQIAVQQQSQKILGGLLAFAFIIVILIFYGYRNKKKTNQLLSLKNIIIEEKNKEIVDSIQYAKRLQNAILPSDQLVKELLPDSFIFYKPKDIVAGDFYFLEKNKGKIIVAAADCTGHGVPGAMVSVVCFNALVRTIKEYGIMKPGAILDKVSELVEETFSKSGDDVKDGMDISLGVLDPHTQIISWAGANNPLWIIRKNNNSECALLEFKPDKQPIGKYDMRSPFTTHSIQLQKEDRIYLFSDGYADQFGGDGSKKFKLSRLRELLLSINQQPMNQQAASLLHNHEKWKGRLEQIDDICVIGLKWN